MNSGIIFDVKRFAIHDGPGIRTTVFLKGCPLDCWWCHNPESRDNRIQQQPQIPLRKCPDLFPENHEKLGEDVSAHDVIDLVLRDRIYYEESGGGVTFSGGEPFVSTEFLEEMLKISKSFYLHTTIDTTGYTEKANIKKVMKYVDLFLYDIKFIDEALHQKYTGVSNRTIIENLEYLRDFGANVIIRIPLIPGITDTEDNLNDILNFLEVNNFNFPIDCLPYNSIGESKYERLGMDLRSGPKERQSEGRLMAINKLIKERGFIVNQEQ